MRERARYSAVMGVCMVLAGFGAPLRAQEISWSPGDPPIKGKIFSPVENGVYACGADVLCVCTPADDNDIKTINGPCPVTYKELDDEAPGYPVWIVIGGGSWKDGDNTGVNPIWIAPNNPQSNISFRMHDDDLPRPSTGRKRARVTMYARRAAMVSSRISRTGFVLSCPSWIGCSTAHTVGGDCPSRM